MPLHKFEKAYLQEIKKDLDFSSEWVDEILAIDNLDSEDTLMKAALIYAYANSVVSRIGKVIEAIDTSSNSEEDSEVSDHHKDNMRYAAEGNDEED